MSKQVSPDRINDGLRIAGAGPAGLAAAITGAKAGIPTVVCERGADVGTRFHGDFQGLENWTTRGDVLEELADLGIQPTFEHVPISEQVCYDPEGREYIFRSPEPFYYLVRRGTESGTLDQALKEQVLAAGVELRFQTPVQHFAEGGVVSQGPRSADVIAVGYRFETDRADGVFSVVNDRLAPKGYSYLLINRGRATLASCMFRDFHKEKVYLERSLQFFRDKVGFEMKNPRTFGGFGNFMLPATATQGQLFFAGEAAGFQDSLWGFGMRYALLSGNLAARAIISQNSGSYERLWRERLGGYLQTSMVNRYLYEKIGNRGYRWLLRSMARAQDPRDWLRKYYAPSRWKAALLPLARRSAKSTRLETEFVHDDCDCTWCRCQHSLVQQ